LGIKVVGLCDRRKNCPYGSEKTRVAHFLVEIVKLKRFNFINFEENDRTLQFEFECRQISIKFRSKKYLWQKSVQVLFEFLRDLVSCGGSGFLGEIEE